MLLLYHLSSSHHFNLLRIQSHNKHSYSHTNMVLQVRERGELSERNMNIETFPPPPPMSPQHHGSQVKYPSDSEQAGTRLQLLTNQRPDVSSVLTNQRPGQCHSSVSVLYFYPDVWQTEIFFLIYVIYVILIVCL